MQIVGKTRLALVPWINHSWHATLYLTARGLTTSTIAHGSGAFEVDFDFGAATLRVAASGVVTSSAVKPNRSMFMADRGSRA